MGKKENPLLTEGAQKIVDGLSELVHNTTAYDVLVGLTCFVAAYCETMHKHHSSFNINSFIGGFMRRLVEMQLIIDEVVQDIRSKKSKDEE